MTQDKRDGHVVLVSLMADQLFGQFLIGKKNWPISETEQLFLSNLLISYVQLE